MALLLYMVSKKVRLFFYTIELSDAAIRRLRFVFILMMLVFFVPGCTHSATTNPADKKLPGLGEPIRVSSGEADAAEPAIASSSEGNVYVAWVDHHPEGKADVMMARFTIDGQMRGTPVRVNPASGTATAWRGDPPTITVAPDHSIFIGWTARVKSEAGHATDLFVSTSRDQGQTFSNPVRVNDDKLPADHGMHSLAVGSDGRVYVAWLDERNVSPVPAIDMKMKQGTSGHHMESNREVFIACSADNGRTFSANNRVASNVCPCCKTSLATAADGRVFLSWRQVLPGDFRHIAVASSADHGQTFTEPKIVSDDQWMLAGCPVSGSTLIVSEDGALHVLWYSAGKNGETGVYSSKSTDNATSFGPRALIAKGQTHGTPVLMNDGRMEIAVWESAGGKIVAALMDNRAPKKEPDVLTITEGELPASVTTPENLFTAYMAKAANGPAIWLVTAKRNELQANFR